MDLVTSVVCIEIESEYMAVGVLFLIEVTTFARTLLVFNIRNLSLTPIIADETQTF